METSEKFRCHSQKCSNVQPLWRAGRIATEPRRAPRQRTVTAKVRAVSALESLDWHSVREQYEIRQRVHGELLRLHTEHKLSQFDDLLLGISDPAGNYSASEHGLGPKILFENLNVEERFYSISEAFLAVESAHDVPLMIRRAGIRYFQIGVGSEASCMMNPRICWVANVRTIRTHLVIKHADNLKKADEELQLYRQADASSEMAYQMWQAIHGELAGTITRIAEEGTRLAQRAKVKPGSIKYIWADAIANQLYGDFYE